MRALTKSFLIVTALILGLTIALLPNASQLGAADMAPSPSVPEGHEVATFAGGCFWCMEPPFDKLKGVKSTTSGYIGGEEEYPTYKEVSAGLTGHTEVVQVVYDPNLISYEELLHVFWRNIDPTVKDRQFCDRGTQYRTGIFYHGEEQKQLAETSKQELLDQTEIRPIVTEITVADTFYPAEEYHQDYYVKNPRRYQMYRKGCRRDARLQEIWGSVSWGTSASK